MYSIIFYYIYSQQIGKGKSIVFAKFNGAVVAFIALVFHIGLILAIIEKRFSTIIHLGILTEYRVVLYAFSLLCMWLLYRFYTEKRIERIKEKYANRKWFQDYGGLVTACVVFIPLLVFIILLS